MKRRDLIVATSGIVGGFALGCSDGTSTAGGSGGTTGAGGGLGSGGTPGAGGSTGGTGAGATGGSGPSGGSSGTGGAGSGGAGTAVTCESVDDNVFHQHPLEVTNEMIEAGVQITLTAGL